MKQWIFVLAVLLSGTGAAAQGILEVENNIFTIDLGDSKVRVPRGYITGTYDPKELDKVEPAPENNK